MDPIDGYFSEMELVTRAVSRVQVRAAVDALEAAWLADQTVFLFGNGGSASTASHMAADLLRGTHLPGQRRLRAIALNDNMPTMTAIANDQEYADVFLDPLVALLRPADVVIAISTSGNSPNVIKAVEAARALDATVIGFCGDPGGRLRHLAHIPIVIPSRRIGQQEDGHLMLDHVITAALFERATLRASAHAGSRDTRAF